MKGAVVAVEGLVKRYEGIAALDAVTFRIDPGEIVALLGSNGAGKSTLFNILTGLRRPSAGSAAVFGLDPFSLPESVKAEIVFVPEEGAIPPWVSADDIARLYRRLYPRFDPGALRRRLDAWDLPPRSRVFDLSKGERRLTELAVALSCEPALLLLDEPFSGLDVVMRFGVMDDLADLHRRMQTTILYSTHILGDVDKLAGRVMILRGGEIAVDRPIEGLREPVETLFMKYYGLGAGRPVAPGES